MFRPASATQSAGQLRIVVVSLTAHAWFECGDANYNCDQATLGDPGPCKLWLTMRVS